jgi:hypothetical protein
MSDQKPSSGGLRTVGERGGVPLGVAKGLGMRSVTQQTAKAGVARTFGIGRGR